MARRLNETMIPIRITTRDMLKGKITRSETYDSYINKLVDFYEKKEGDIKC